MLPFSLCVAFLFSISLLLMLLLCLSCSKVLPTFRAVPTPTKRISHTPRYRLTSVKSAAHYWKQVCIVIVVRWLSNQPPNAAGNGDARCTCLRRCNEGMSPHRWLGLADRGEVQFCLLSGTYFSISAPSRARPLRCWWLLVVGSALEKMPIDLPTLERQLNGIWHRACRRDIRIGSSEAVV